MNKKIEEIKIKAMQARQEFEYANVHHKGTQKANPFYLIGQLMSICGCTYCEDEIMKIIKED